MKPAPAATLLFGLAACSAGGDRLSLPSGEQGAARARPSYAVAYSFRGSPDGYVPTSRLISDGSGRLYGVTYYGGATARGCNGTTGCGTFFMFDPASQQETVLYSFGKTRTDGQLPSSLLFYNGSFYGTTQDGGTSASLGTVFKIMPPAREGATWNETILHRFRGSPKDGSSPVQLTIDASGTIYGAAADGGRVTTCFLGCGAIFKLTPQPGKGEWRETILHSFAGVPDGNGPISLILASNGTLYGETDWGGRSTACGANRGCGTVFALTPSHGSRWTETILHAFKAAKAPKNDGEFPDGLTLTSDGTLYGVTAYGGPPRRCYTRGYPWTGCGTFFRLKSASGQRSQWSESILHFFEGDAYEAPDSIASDGRGFYGTSAYGGGGYCNRGWGCGTLFHLTPPPQGQTKWTEAIAHAFGGGTTDGWDPSGAVVADRKGLYGVTMYGGSGSCSLGCGTIYEYEP